MRQCRFCLEEDTTTSNPLVSPCACRGSVQYVHPDCVKKWVIHDGVYEETRLRCTLCRVPLESCLPALEMIDPREGLLMFVLYNPFAISVFIQYFFMVYEVKSERTPLELFKASQYCINILYLLLFLFKVKINNPYLYARIAYRRLFLLRLALQLYLNWSFFYENSVMAAFGSNMLLTIYWPDHQFTLGDVNTELLKN